MSDLLDIAKSARYRRAAHRLRQEAAAAGGLSNVPRAQTPIFPPAQQAAAQAAAKPSMGALKGTAAGIGAVGAGVLGWKLIQRQARLEAQAMKRARAKKVLVGAGLAGAAGLAAPAAIKAKQEGRI